MASLLLFLRAIVISADDEELDEGRDAAARERRPENWAFGPAAARDAEEEEEERWLVSCLEWPRVDRKSAWMQMV
jgi:hypothetical protein